VPSVIDSAAPPPYTAAVERVRELVRAAVLKQNLPGVSVAVAAGGMIVWGEGFGWREVDTQTPVTPKTEFNIGTAASAVTAAVDAPLGLTNTGAIEASRHRIDDRGVHRASVVRECRRIEGGWAVLIQDCGQRFTISG
jgi:hypothetical protein